MKNKDNLIKEQELQVNYSLTEEEMKRLIRIARKGYHESRGDYTQWHFDIDKESDVIKEYLNSK